jgi:hypothetical protein
MNRNARAFLGGLAEGLLTFVVALAVCASLLWAWRWAMGGQ